MAWRIWEKLAPGTAIDTVLGKLNDWMKTNGAVFTGGDRAAGALDATGTLTSGMSGDATIAGKPAGGVAANYSVEFQETFEASTAGWVPISGTKNQTVVGTGQTGGKAIRQVGPCAEAFPWPLPYDGSKLHRLRAKVKRVSGFGTFSYGVRALDAAGGVLGTYAIAALGVAPGASYTEYTGWLLGTGATTTPAPDVKTPSALPAGTVAIQPYYALNTGDPSGVMELDSISYDRQEEDIVARAANALLSPTTTDPTDAARYAAGARTVADAIDSDSIQVDVAIVGLLQSITDPTVFIDLRTTPAPGDIIVSLPGFVADNLGNATFSGALSAASGTFSGALVGATGTFSGSLSAASGTFSGTVSAGGTIAAASFTAPSALFTGDLGVVGTTGFLGDVTFGLGTIVSFNAGFSAAGSTITGLSVGNYLSHTGSLAGFFGTAATSKPTVTGSRGGNAALASLLTALAALGLITDSSTP